MNSKKDKFTFSKYSDHEGEYTYINLYMTRSQTDYEEKNNASLNYNFSNAVIDEPWKYEVCLGNITCELSQIPLLVYKQIDYTFTGTDGKFGEQKIQSFPFYVGLLDTASGDFYAEEVVSNLADDIKKPFFYYNYNTFANEINDALNEAVNDLNFSHPGTIPANSIYFIYDSRDEKFKLIVRKSIFSGISPTVGIYLNSNIVDSIGRGFPVSVDYDYFFNKGFTPDPNLPDNDPAYKVLVSELYSKTCNALPNFEDDPAGSFIKVEQEYKTINTFCDVMGIRVTSNVIGIGSELFTPPLSWSSSGSSTSSTAKVESLIGDFFGDFENAGDPRNKVIFYPTSEKNWHDLTKFTSISNIDANLQWINKESDSFGFKPGLGELFVIKYIFRKKRQYLTQRVREVEENTNRSYYK